MLSGFYWPGSKSTFTALMYQSFLCTWSKSWRKKRSLYPNSTRDLLIICNIASNQENHRPWDFIWPINFFSSPKQACDPEWGRWKDRGEDKTCSTGWLTEALLQKPRWWPSAIIILETRWSTCTCSWSKPWYCCWCGDQFCCHRSSDNWWSGTWDIMHCWQQCPYPTTNFLCQIGYHW